MTERKQSGIPGQNIIWKVAFRTVGRYGKISFLMLFIGFLFVLTTANAYSQLYEELSSSYVISGSVSGQAELEKYNEISLIDVATPVFNVTSTLSNQEASLSASITAVTSDYVDVTFLRGGTFPDESNMPFLVLNRYAAEHFTTQDDTVIAVDVNDTVMMTIQEQEVSAVICGIFEDGLERKIKDKPILRYTFNVKTSNIEKQFVREQYKGRCQICGRESIRKHNGDIYFEAINIISTANLNPELLNDVSKGWNTLCLCPTCAAEYRYCSKNLDGFEKQIDTTVVPSGKSDYIPIQIILKGVSTQIRFTPKHFIALKTAFNVYRKHDKSE